MVKDFLISFGDNFKEKTRNPFLGTYLIVWLFRNWELIYSIFHFDNEQKLNDKVDFIKNYYSEHNFIANLLSNILWAFGLLILTYLLLNISRLIVNLSEKRVTPWIYELTDSKSIVLKSEYERIRVERDDVQVRLDKERESRSKLETRIKNLESEILEASKAQAEKPIESTTKSKSEGSQKGPIDETSILLEKLRNKNLLRDFKDSSIRINKGEFIKNDYNPKDYFIELGLIKFSSDHVRGDSKKYVLTQDGENLLKRARLELE